MDQITFVCIVLPIVVVLTVIAIVWDASTDDTKKRK